MQSEQKVVSKCLPRRSGDFAAPLLHFFFRKMIDPPSYGTFIEFEVSVAKELRLAVFSYFWNVHRFSGLRVPQRRSEEARKKKVLRSGRWVFAILIIILLLYRVIFLFVGFRQMRDFSHERIALLINLCLSVHGFASAVALFVWTRRDLLKDFLREVSTTTAHKTISIGSVVSTGRNKALFTAVVLLSFLSEVFHLLGTALDGRAIKGSPRDTPFQGPLFFARELYPLELLLAFYSLAVSLTAIALFYLMTSLMFAEFKQFNKELKLAASNHRLLDEEVFCSFCDRHFDLLHLVRRVNAHVGVFVTTSVVSGLFIHFLAIFIVTNLSESASWLEVVTCGLWFFVGTGFALTPMRKASALISEAHESAQILVFEKSLGQNLKAECRPTTDFYTHRMTDRVLNGDYYVRILRAFNLTSSLTSVIYFGAFLGGMVLNAFWLKVVHKDSDV
ncbi:hypothetical protein QR680_005463 [Steinernema hermaphroditum]|uniref:Uncharacterized protein n=1 Tax=Steinernema hermaphroditum TaxID=289476 RepID=A0AA39HUD1_9BILA|nr:hypothetical protein QR680_005463 [Steinernema hermaphroditum]